MDMKVLPSRLHNSLLASGISYAEFAGSINVAQHNVYQFIHRYKGKRKGRAASKIIAGMEKRGWTEAAIEKAPGFTGTPLSDPSIIEWALGKPKKNKPMLCALSIRGGKRHHRRATPHLFFDGMVTVEQAAHIISYLAQK